MAKKPALGRGLSALLENDKTDVTSNSKASESKLTAGSISEIEISKIVANPFQPRTKFEEEELNDLAQSIKELGIIQPITLRKMGYDSFQIISGERRFRASQIAGLTKVPAYIRIANDQAMLEMALVENIQRSNLDAIEVALSYQRLIDECNLTQEEMSNRVGKNRSTITNYLRLLKLPADIQEGIRSLKISMGHARALISIDDEASQREIFQQIVKDKLSVRKVEELAKEKKVNTISKPTVAKLPLSLVDKKLIGDLSDCFRTKVKFSRTDYDKGKIVIPFNSDEELEKILKKIKL